MVNPIVTVNVSLTQPPAPNNLQKTGAIISQGGTTLGVQSYQLITEPDDLTPYLAAPLALSSLSWSSAYGGQVTATAASAHGIAVGQAFITTIAGAVPSAYNGTYRCIATTTTAFTYYLASNPGSETTPGTYTPRNSAELVAAVASYFGQGKTQSVYVLELGAGEPATGISNLSAFIAAQPTQKFYAYLVPRNWDGVSSFLTLVALYENTNSQTYFFTTTNPQNYALYTSTMKSVIPFIEAPFYGRWSTNVITAGSWSGGSATLTTTSAHGVYPGQFFQISGVSPSGYNGRFMALPGTTGSTLVYAVASDPGAYVSGGTLVQSLYASAGVPATSFDLATYFQIVLSQSPNGTTRVPPFAFNFLYGVTQFPVQGNASFLTQLTAANISYVASAGQGGLSQNMLFKGHSADGKPFNYWYAIDWLSINLVLDLTNAVINGSNNKSNPLYYNQDGINRLEQVAFGTCSRSIQFGLFLGTPKQYGYSQDEFNQRYNDDEFTAQLAINAVPFTTYTTLNPDDYPQGLYGGLSAIAIPQNGFEEIIFNVTATQFIG
jgi:hypothetical protein